MKKITKIFTIFMSVLVMSCHSGDISDKLIPKEESQFARIFLEKLRAGDFDYVKRFVDKSIEGKVTDQTLKELSAYFPSGALISDEIIGSQVNILNNQWQGSFTFEYHTLNGWSLANVVLRKAGQTLSVVGFSVYRTTESQGQLNKFSLYRKNASQYLMLAIAILTSIFVLVSAYCCFRTPITKRKWLWIIVTLIGFSSISMNWTTGQYFLQLLWFKILPVSFSSAGTNAPWIISMSLPIGAVVFWCKRKSLGVGTTAPLN
jgi:hypothetical protein